MRKLFTACALTPLLCAVFLFGCSAESEPPVSEPRAAYVAGREYCKRALKSPASAKFFTQAGERDFNSVGVNVQQNVWTAGGSVESQNAFGATIRAPWVARVKRVERGWELIEVVIDGK